MLSVLISTIALWAIGGKCVLQNISVDDTNGNSQTNQNIVYNSGEWKTGLSCTSCEAKVSPLTDVFDQTWQDTTFEPGQPLLSASLTFSGSAVYVVCILSGSGNSDMTFFLDNIKVDAFQQGPKGGPFQFGIVVFSKDNLNSNQLHNITLVNGMLGQEALVLLDRIIYTTDVADDRDTSNTTSDPGTSTTTLVTEVTVEGSTMVSTKTETFDETRPAVITVLSMNATTSSSSTTLNPQPPSAPSPDSSLTTKPLDPSAQPSTIQSNPFGSDVSSHEDTHSHNSHAGVIAVCILVPVIVLALFGGGMAFWFRRKKSQLHSRADPWLDRIHTANDGNPVRAVSTDSIMVQMSLGSVIHMDRDDLATAPSFDANSVSDSKTDLISEMNPPSYEADFNNAGEADLSLSQHRHQSES